jgi:acylpyruvate hydrolase
VSPTPSRTSAPSQLTFPRSYSPVGDFIDASTVKDPHALEMWFKINGETKQKDSTNLMLYRIPELIQHCSSIMTLEEGDLLLTGQSLRLPFIQ